tara:strand:- start:1224 stop:1532 length:309 start_codon:yes stop_codon:yes gene_type:complete
MYSGVHGFKGDEESRQSGVVKNFPARHRNGHIFSVSVQITELRVGSVALFRCVAQKVDIDIEVVLTISSQGVIQSCNRNFVVPLFGYSAKEILGTKIYGLSM